MIEELLNKPYWVIDILPEQVPENSAGQYARIEEYFLQYEQMAALRQRFATILLKLNCYDDFHVLLPDESQSWDNPTPHQLADLLTCGQYDLLILLKEKRCLITANRDDTYMTVYNPSSELRNRIRALAASEGLFFWQPLAGAFSPGQEEP